MDKREQKEKLLSVCRELFRDTGVDLDLIEYIHFVDDLGMDSITFISLVVELEGQFQLEVPDEMLLIENFEDFDKTMETLTTILSAEEKRGESDDDKT